MIQVNRVARIARKIAWRTGKIPCCTVAKVIQHDRIRAELMPARIVITNLEAYRLVVRSAVVNRAADEGSGPGMTQFRMYHFDGFTL